MRVLSMIKADARSESETPPDPAEMAAMGKLGEEGVKRGLLLEQGGLASSKHGARVTFEGGKPRVTDGPFAETKELIAGFAILHVKTFDEAIAESLELPIKAELELRVIAETDDFPQDLPAIQKEKEFRAAGPKLNGNPQWMLLLQPHGESLEAPPAEIIEQMGRYNEALIEAGALVAGEGLHPSVTGARVNVATRDVLRGPFSNKYLVCGWWTIQAPTKADAIAWAKRVPIREGTIEVRKLYNPHMPNAICNPNGAQTEARV